MTEENKETTTEEVEEVKEEVKETAEEAVEDEKELKGLAKKFIGIMMNEFDQIKEVKRDVKKGKLYTEQYTRKEITDLDWREQCLDFTKSLVGRDYSRLQEYQKLNTVNETTAAMGGYLVPEEWAGQIKTRIGELSVVRPRADVRQTIRDTYNIPKEDSTLKPSWRGAESAVKSTTSVTFDQNTLTPYVLAGIVVVTNEMLMDNAYNVSSVITNQFARKFAEAEDEAFLTGNGTNKPTGLDNYTAGSTISAGGALSGDMIINAYHKLNPAYRANAVWICHPYIATLVRSLKASTSGIYLVTDLAGSPTPTLMGRPMLESSAMAQSKLFLVDLNEYVIVDRYGLTMRMSDETALEVNGTTRSMFQRNETAILAEERTDGELIYTSAFVEINTI